MKKPALEILRLASSVGLSKIAVKSRVSAAKSPFSMLDIELPVPLASKEKPVMAPVLEMSQSEVLISPVSPLSPKMKRPDVWKLSEIEALEPKKTLPDMEAVPPTSNMVLMTLPGLIPKRAEEPVSSKLPDKEALAVKRANPSKADDPLTSRPPEIRRSSNELIVP